MSAPLIERLRERARIESPDGDTAEDRTAFEDVPEVTWEEMREISALLTEAAACLARFQNLSSNWRAIADRMPSDGCERAMSGIYLECADDLDGCYAEPRA